MQLELAGAAAAAAKRRRTMTTGQKVRGRQYTDLRTRRRLPLRTQRESKEEGFEARKWSCFRFWVGNALESVMYAY